LLKDLPDFSQCRDLHQRCISRQCANHEPSMR
jgi:hypothetical protein